VKESRPRLWSTQITSVFPAKAGTHASALSEPVKQLQCLTERLSVRAGGAMGPGLRRGEEWMIGGGLFHKLSGRRFDQHAL
jgi:hypothetical protein